MKTPNAVVTALAHSTTKRPAPDADVLATIIINLAREFNLPVEQAFNVTRRLSISGNVAEEDYL